jgi:nucleoside-diphosphate-sugar epimerase
MRILFTGATSLAGRRSYERLIGDGHHAVAVSRQELGGDSPAVRVDLEADDAHLQLPDEPFDVLVHFASFVPFSERGSRWEECSLKNVHTTARLLRWAEGRVQRIVLASSCAVYGARKLYTPTDETHPVRPDTAYALSKYGQERLVEAFCRSRGIPSLFLRLGYVWGPDVPDGRAIVRFVDRVRSGQPIALLNARTAGLHLVHQDDIAHTVTTLLDHGAGIYNLASPVHISLLDYVQAAIEFVGREVELTCEDPPGAPVTNHYSCRQLEEDHGIVPRVPLTQGIAEILARLERDGSAEA